MTPTAPAWCSFFSPEQYERFATLVRAEFIRRGIRADFNLEDGYADCQFPGTLQNRIGLAGPAQKCHMRPEREWVGTLTEHFSSLDRIEGAADQMESFEAVRDSLRLRLYPDPYGDYPDQTVHRGLTVRIATHLVVDTPNDVWLVLRSHLREWGKTEDELFILGLEQSRRFETLAPTLIDLGGGNQCYTIRGNSFMVTANALWLDDYIDPSGRGALVAVPNRHEILFHKIQSLEPLVWMLAALPKTVRALYQAGPGSISSEVFWWHAGRWTHLPLKPQADDPLGDVPPEFIEEAVKPLGAQR